MKETTPEDVKKMSPQEQEAFSLGRISVLRDFHNMCAADSFMGFSDEEFNGFKKVIKFNEELAGLDFEATIIN